MVRIIPWNLPPVNGGSVGGYTPAPTPPVPTNYPYDLDDLVLSSSFESAGTCAIDGNTYFNYVKGKLSLSGVKILDSSTVSSVIATVHVTPGTDTWEKAQNHWNLVEADVDVDITNKMSSDGGSVDLTNKTGYFSIEYLEDFYARNVGLSYYPDFKSTTATATVTSIKVYNGNGVVLQEWTP